MEPHDILLIQNVWNKNRNCILWKESLGYHLNNRVESSKRKKFTESIDYPIAIWE